MFFETFQVYVSSNGQPMIDSSTTSSMPVDNTTTPSTPNPFRRWPAQQEFFQSFDKPEVKPLKRFEATVREIWLRTFHLSAKDEAEAVAMLLLGKERLTEALAIEGVHEIDLRKVGLDRNQGLVLDHDCSEDRILLRELPKLGIEVFDDTVYGLEEICERLEEEAP
jgi:hypothetical protein